MRPVIDPLATIGGANDQVLDGVRWSFRLLGRWRVDKKRPDICAHERTKQMTPPLRVSE